MDFILLSIIGLFVVGFLGVQLFFKLQCAWCRSNVYMGGKTAIVTGGSRGIGYHIVLNLLSRGCKVIVADRIVDEEIKTSMINATKNNEICLEYVDLTSFKSVRDFVSRIKAKEDKIDILIHNAGLGNWFGPVSEDGLDVVMQINYYSAFLMTHLLQDLLKKSQSARVIFCASFLSYFGRLNLESLNNDDVTIGTKHLEYNTSKLCFVAAAVTFAEKFEKYNITSNSCHPGCVNTVMTQTVMDRRMTFKEALLGLAVRIATIFIGKTPEEGAQTAIHLACANEVENVTGQFFGENKVQPKPSLAKNKQLREALWLHSERAVRLKQDEKLF